jgi:DNA protecting protein DprA
MTDLSSWLALLHAPGLGPRIFRSLLDALGSAQAILEADPAQLASLGLSKDLVAYLASPDWSAVERDLAWLNQPDTHIITLDDQTYPPLLRAAADAPPLLYVRGDLDVLCSLQLAVVGSRNPTPGGWQTAYLFARHLAKAGLNITSGLARGIDAASHRGALDGGGATIAVAGTGLDRVYPPGHHSLAHEIAGHGALVSEFPLGTPPASKNFPRRNRVISGLSLGTLVVEAGLRSGSLITARHALEQGREVFAVPGSIHNPLARGCHALLRQGAKLVETADHILEELDALALACAQAQDAPVVPPATTPALDPEYQRILDCLGYDPISIEVLVERTGLTADAVSSMLLILELQGYVASHAGGLYTRFDKRV